MARDIDSKTLHVEMALPQADHDLNADYCREIARPAHTRLGDAWKCLGVSVRWSVVPSEYRNLNCWPACTRSRFQSLWACILQCTFNLSVHLILRPNLEKQGWKEKNRQFLHSLQWLLMRIYAGGYGSAKFVFSNGLFLCQFWFFCLNPGSWKNYPF